MGGTPLHHSAWWGHGDVVALLLERGADPQRRAEPGIGGTALGWTAHGSFHSPGTIAGGGTDHRRIAELLVATGVQVEAEMIDAAEILLGLGVAIGRAGQMGGTPLHHAAWWGHGDVVALLLERGADPHRRAEPGIGGTALGWTAHGSFHSPGPIAGGGTDHRRIAELLVAAGAAIEAETIDDADAELAEWLRERLEEAGPG